MRLSFAAAVSFVLAGTASAQTMDFTEWCRDVAQHDAARCAEARSGDKSVFDTYASRTAQFEAELKAKKARDEALTERMNRMDSSDRGSLPGE